MVAPNGARRGKAAHPALPITIAEMTDTAAACYAAGTRALHAHVRDERGEHTLDAGLYRELLREVEARVPAMAVQITTESAGVYAAAAQRRLLRELRPPWASVALAEMMADKDVAAATRLYHWAAEEGVGIQHILYAADEVDWLARLIADGVIPAVDVSLLFVLGRYAPAVNGAAAMLPPFLQARARMDCDSRFMVCAFGAAETDCLLAAAAAGGDCRVGFENNLYHPDGTLAEDNAARVGEVVKRLGYLRRF